MAHGIYIMIFLGVVNAVFILAPALQFPVCMGYFGYFCLSAVRLS